MKPHLLALSVVSAPVLTLALLAAEPDAHACGGCAVPPDTNTQVTGHRMILAASKTQTTLYDQIEYSGAPESFAWFLPIKGQVDIGLSADALFALLNDSSQVTVFPPPLKCVSSGRNGLATAEDSASGGGSVYVPPDEEVNVIAKETVGPYETVQLDATTPAALTGWLTDHGYFIPDDVKPVIEAYQKEGFDFLAMKLVPGQGVKSMRPVRVTTPGGALALPLRMVAAGTGAVTPVLLHVVAEGRYEVANRTNWQIPAGLLVWDWDQGTSNYRELREGLFGVAGSDAWLVESAAPFYKDSFSLAVQYQIEGNPGQSGWGDPDNGVTELDDAKADVDTLFAGMDPQSAWVTRMYAKLSREALAEDLVLEAASDQTPVGRFLQAPVGKGTPPACPAVPLDWSCAFGAPERDGTALFLGVTGLIAGLAFARRRRGVKRG